MNSAYAGKSVLVTGAGGSIGSELCKVIVSHNAKSLTLLSLTEAGLYNIDRTLRKDYGKYRDTKVIPVLGSVLDRALLDDVLHGVDVVIHAAAHKHVPICEANPLAAIENNVKGTFQLLRAVAKEGCVQFCLVSTDKAVNPISVMGRTKRLAELMVAHYSTSSARTNYFTVRFGNVLDSAGSVMPLWREQIAAGGPLTLTDARCERYFMSIPEAVGLIGDTIALSPLAGTFVLDMGQPQKLRDIAERMILESGLGIALQYIGLRPGEKLTEELYHGGVLKPTLADRVFAVEETTQQREFKEAELWGLFNYVENRNAVDALALLERMTA
jgi:FlaA1/EpsC-like NDP-sugar epimerase